MVTKHIQKRHVDVDLNNAVSPLVTGKLREEFCALVDGEATQMPCIMEIGLSPTQIFQHKLHIPHQPVMYMLRGHVFIIDKFEDSASFRSKRAVPGAPGGCTTIRRSD